MWKPIPEFAGVYEANEIGEIRRVGKGRGVRNGRAKAQRLMNAGYLLCSLSVGNHAYGRLVHRLIAAAFLGPCPAGHEVNHKNLDKLDNRAVNLEYLTRSANLLHRSAAGIGRGTRNGMHQLDEVAVLAIRQRHAHGEGYKRLGKEFGVSWGTQNS